jgi:hypothetical protein
MSTVDRSRAARAERIAREYYEQLEDAKEDAKRAAMPLVLTGKSIEPDKKGADHIYINVSAPSYRPYTATAASYRVQLLDKRDQPIIKDPENWYLSMVRFNMPTQLIPITYMSIYTGTNGFVPSTNIDLTNYAIVLQSPLGTQTQQSLIWTTENPLSTPQAPSVAVGVTESFVFNNLLYYSLFSYNTFIAMINTALAAAFTSARTVPDWPAGATLPPYLTLDETTGIISLWAQTAYDSTAAFPIKIFFNSELYEFFQSSFETSFNGFHPVKYPAPPARKMADWQIIVRNRGNNYSPNVPNNPIPFTLPGTVTTASNVIAMASTAGLVVGQLVSGAGIPAGSVLVSFVANVSATISENATLASSPLATTITFTSVPQPGYQMRQEFACLINWSSFSSISFTTGSLPVKTEYAPLVYASDDTSTGTTGGAGITPIVTDFVASSSGPGTDLRTYVTYIPPGEYRLSSLLSGKAIDTIQLSMYWQDAFGNNFPIYCTNNVSCTAKLMFRRKEIGGGIGLEPPLSGAGYPGTVIARPGFRGNCAKCMSGGCVSCGGEGSGLKGVI